MLQYFLVISLSTKTKVSGRSAHTHSTSQECSHFSHSRTLLLNCPWGLSIKGLVGTICFQDDAPVHGRTRSQCEFRGMAVTGRLEYKGLTNITILGFTFSVSGLSKMSIKSGKSSFLKVYRKSNRFVDWSISMTDSSQTSRLKIAQISDLRKWTEVELQ